MTTTFCLRRAFGRVCWVAVAVVLALHAPACGDLVVASGGRSEYRILVPAEPCAEERRAAEELREHLRQAAGVQLEVASGAEPGAGPFLIVARSDAAPAASLLAREGVPRLPDHEEAMLVATVDDDVLLTGRAPHAVCYAVYDFLETEVGCAWLFPGELGAEVPRIETLRVGALGRVRAPSVPCRWIGGGEWALRNRMNMRLRLGRERLGVEELFGGHSFKRILPPRVYHEEHPEYYALVNGERRRSKSRGHGDQYCTSNAEMAGVVTGNMRRALDAQPRARVISLSPNDGLGFCECAACLALDDAGAYTLLDVQRRRKDVPWEEARRLLSRRMLLFYNQVADELAVSHPNVLVKSFAYSLYAAPPRDPALRCAPNLMIQLCHGLCHNHALTDGRCEYNRGYRSFIDGWTTIGRHLSVYEYYWKVAWLDLPWPILHAMRKDLPYYQQKGLKLFYTQYAANYAGGFGPVYWIAARLLWDVSADVDALLDRYCVKAYGAAAGPMARYYRFWEERMAASEAHISHTPPVDAILAVFTPENLARADVLLAQAERTAGAGKARKRVERLRWQWEWTRLVSRYVHVLKGVRQDYASHWVGGLAAAGAREVRAKASPVLARMRGFMSEHEKDAVVRSWNNNYIARFLNPFSVLTAIDALAGEGSDEPLAADQWLGTRPAHKRERRPVPPGALDLWVYGNDFDTDGAKSEHELFVVGPGGERRSIGGLAPPGQDGNRVNRCYVVPGLSAQDLSGAAVRIAVVNPAGDWTVSTLFAFYVMPPIPDMTHRKATVLVERHLDWVRAQSAGFFEHPREGRQNADGADELVRIPIIGLPAAATPAPEVPPPEPFHPSVSVDQGAGTVLLEHEDGVLSASPSAELSAGPLVSLRSSQTLFSRLGAGFEPERPLEFGVPPGRALSLETAQGRTAVFAAADGATRLELTVGGRAEGFAVALTLAEAPAGLFFPVIEMPGAMCDSVVYAGADGDARADSAILTHGGKIDLARDWFALRNTGTTDEGVLFVLPGRGWALHVGRRAPKQKWARFAVAVPQAEAVKASAPGKLAVRFVPYAGDKGWRRALQELGRR